MGLGLLVLVLAGCGGETATEAGETGEAGDAMAVRDSAGVRIVENGAASESGWSVRTEPLFRVGWEDDGPLLSEPQSGRILSDGGALVGEESVGTVYRLGPDGAVLDTFGGKGEGPGEFDRLDGMVLKGDSTVVSDLGLMRLTFIAPDGGVRTARLPSHTRSPRASTVIDDGRLLIVPGGGYGGSPAGQSGWVFETEPILAVSADAADIDTLAVLPHVRLWYDSRAGRPGPVLVKGRAGGYPDGFAWARSDRRAVRWYDSEGRLLQIARWEEEPTELDAAWRERYVTSYREAWVEIGYDDSFIESQLGQTEAGFDRYDLPLPYWDGFHVDRSGNVWLGRYPPPREASDEWRIIARDGTFVGWIELPGVISVLDITEDRVLGVVRNELDVPAVVMLELVKR